MFLSNVELVFLWSIKAVGFPDTLTISRNQARNQLGTPGGAQIFSTMSNSFKLYPTHFSMGEKSFLGGAKPPCAPTSYGPARNILFKSLVSCGTKIITFGFLRLAPDRGCAGRLSDVSTRSLRTEDVHAQIHRPCFSKAKHRVYLIGLTFLMETTPTEQKVLCQHSRCTFALYKVSCDAIFNF